MTFKTVEEAQVCCDNWLKILNLVQWKVEVKIVRAHELGADRVGGIWRYLAAQRAILRLLDPIDYNAFEITDHLDQEKTIVHELLHIYEADITDIVEEADEKLYERLYGPRERLVEQLAMSFVDLHRKLSPDHVEIVEEETNE